MPSPDIAEWTVADLIDFELLTLEDEGMPQESDEAARNRLVGRDRAIYLQICEEQSKNRQDKSMSLSNRSLFRQWLNHRRHQIYTFRDSMGMEASSLFHFIFCILFALGCSVAFTIVKAMYRTEPSAGVLATPTNVLEFWIACILLPLLFTFYSFWIAVGHRTSFTLPRVPSFLSGMYFRVIGPLLRSAINQAVENSSPDACLNANALRGDIRAILVGRKGILAAFFFLWVQGFSLGYAVSLPIFVSYRNFKGSQDFAWSTNWQSITPERVYGAAKWVSLPWGWWMGAGDGFPTIDQVMITQNRKYDPGNSEKLEASAPWAHFFVLSSLFWVLIPRGALFLGSRFCFRRSLAAETFDGARYDALKERLTLPKTQWDEKDAHGSPRIPDHATDAATVPHNIPRVNPAVCVVAISEDLTSDALDAAVENYLNSQKQWEVVGRLKVGEDEPGRQAFLKQISSVLSAKWAGRLLLIEDAAMPPARERLNFYSRLRGSIGLHTGIIVALIGPDGDGPLGTSPRAQDVIIWKQKLKSLGDPNLRVIDFHSN